MRALCSFECVLALFGPPHTHTALEMCMPALEMLSNGHSGAILTLLQPFCPPPPNSLDNRLPFWDQKMAWTSNPSCPDSDYSGSPGLGGMGCDVSEARLSLS